MNLPSFRPLIHAPFRRARVSAMLAALVASSTGAPADERTATARDTLLQSDPAPAANALPPVALKDPAQVDPGSVLLGEALRLYRAGEYEKAIAAAQGAADQLPASANPHVITGSSWLRLGQVDRGIAALRAGLQLNPDSVSALVALGNAQLEHGDLAEARKHFQAIADRWPVNSEADQGLGLVSEREGKLAEAARHFEATVSKMPPGLVGVRPNLARLYNRQRQFEKTIALLGDLANRNPVDESAVELLAIACLGAGRPHEAIRAYERALAASPSAPLALGLGLAHRQANQLPESLKALQQATKLRNNWPPAWLQLAETQIAMGDMSAAKASLERARSFGADAAAIDTRIAEVHQLANEHAEAIALLQRVAAAKADDPLAWDRLATAFERKGDFAGAERVWRETARRFPKMAGPHVMLGLFFERRGRGSDAVAALSEAAALEPENPAVLRAFALGCRTAGDWPRAIAAARQLVARVPADIDAKLLLAMLHGQASDDRSAAEIYRQVLATVPDHAIALNNLASIHLRAGDFDEAMRLSRQAVSLLPRSGQLLDTLGWAAFLKGATADAAKTLERAAEYSPNDPSIQFHLGMALMKQKQNPEALRCFKRAIDLSKDFAEYKQAVEMISALRS